MYGTLADWITYAGLRGLVVPNAAASTQALLRASDYIRTRYVLRFTSPVGTSAEAIEATYIAAAFEIATPGFWATTFTASQVKVLTGVGSISWSVVAMGGMSGTDAMLPTSPAIDALLAPLMGWGVTAAMVV